jgi:hypothetical protein
MQCSSPQPVAGWKQTAGMLDGGQAMRNDIEPYKFPGVFRVPQHGNHPVTSTGKSLKATRMIIMKQAANQDYFNVVK